MPTTKKESHLNTEELKHYSSIIEKIIEEVGTLGLDEAIESIGYKSTRQGFELAEENKMLLEFINRMYSENNFINKDDRHEAITLLDKYDTAKAEGRGE